VETFLNLLLREAAMLCVVSSVGSSFATFLPASRGIGSRIALVPVLGLAAASCALTTASWITAMDVGVWVVLVPLAVASLGLTVFRIRGGRVEDWRPRRAEVASVAILLVVSFTALNIPLAERGSLGPMGYLVYDAPGYVAETGEYQAHTVREQEKLAGSPDFTTDYAARTNLAHQQVGYDMVSAATNELFGWPAWSTQSAFMAVLVAIGALGCFATVRGLTGMAGPGPLVAGLLFVGPLFYQLWIDGSEGALAGLTMIAPIALLGARLIRHGSYREAALLGLLIAGFQTLYGIMVPGFAIGVAMVLAVLLAAGLVTRRVRVAVLGRAAKLLGLVVLFAIALSPVAFARNVDYWRVVSGESYLRQGFPKYDLPVQVIPGWILQTREFYFLPHLSAGGLQGWILGGLVPLVLIGLIVFGLWRFRWALILVGGALAAAGLAYYALNRYDCSYCEQRNLLTLGPVAAVFTGVAVTALWTWRGAVFKVVAVAVGVVILVLAGHKSSVEARRAVDGAYVVPSSLDGVLDALDHRPGPVLLEGLGAGYDAPAELPATYNAVDETTRSRLALPAEIDDHNGLAYYLGPRKQAGPEFTPSYRWVLTRLGGVSTSRRLVARGGPYALEERTRPLDVTVVGGVTVDSDRHDPRGLAWVTGPLIFWVSSSDRSSATVRLTLTGQAGARAVAPSGSRVLRRAGDRVTLCIPVRRKGSLRRVRVELNIPAAPPTGPPEQFAVRAIPPHQLRLEAMTATTAGCDR
jgi:hypothetical protein